ncbi:Receptor-like protein 12 [Linum perenne]
MSLLSLVPLILPVLIVSSHVPLVFGRCREDQQSLLVQLKGGLNFTDSISVKLARWNVSTDCCEWPGISCDVGGLGRVIGLDLSGEWINGGGGLDDSMTLFSLQYLERLDLSYNEFNTTIPAALANLTNLRYMDLSNADFFGKIPASISQLTSLTSLNLSCWVSCVKKLEISNLALLVQNLTQLTHLRLDGVNLSAQIPDSLAELKNLTTLRMANCGLIGTFPKKIAQSLTLLEYLDLSNNQLQGPIPRSIFELSSLDTLSLSSNRFSGSVQLSWIHTLQNLKNLDLSNNKHDNQLEGNFPFVPSSIYLDFSHNRFNGSFPTETFNNQHSVLSFLSLSNNRFIGIIPTSICNASFLQVVDFSNNNLNDTIPSCLLKDLKKLSVLDLRGNMLTGKIPDTFQTSSALQTLDLSNNQLQGRIPESLENSSSYVDFSHNHFSGSFLTEFFNNQYTRLTFLSLSNNRLTGIIPTSICNHAGLEVVDFSNNYLNGTIPSCLSKDLNELSVLDLRRNMLSGNILNTFQVSCALQTLDLSNNQLEGIFPESLENCTNLEVLDIGYNKISDVFPCIQGIKSSLHVLILRNNLFHGSLWCRYGDLTTWQQLQIVDLAFNNFTGPLNDKFLLTWEAMMQDGKGTKDRIKFNSDSSGYYHNSITVSMKGLNLEFVKILTVFKSIDLSSNNFVGPIPEVIGKFKAIQVLNLSHNAFSGQIPSEFGNLSNVESLDLSHNKLTGQIPNELTGLTFLSCMDLSYNNLVGRIPTGTQFQSFDNTSFGGNLDLCGQPLSKSCTDPPTLSGIIVSHEKSSIRINWDILSKVFGFFCGLALIMLPASLWPSFRIWYWPKIDSVILWMFPKLYVKDWNNRLSTRQTRRRNKRTKATQ